MAKVFKVLSYFTDANGDYQDQEHFEEELKRVAERHDLTMYIAEAHESEEFEWRDDLDINYKDSTEEEFEHYFKEQKRGTNILKEHLKEHGKEYYENVVNRFDYNVAIDIRSKDEIYVTVTKKSTGETRFKKTQSFFISAEQQGRAVARNIIDEWKAQEEKPRVIKYESD